MPHVYTCPSFVNATVWCCPTASCFTCARDTCVAGRGTGWSDSSQRWGVRASGSTGTGTGTEASEVEAEAVTDKADGDADGDEDGDEDEENEDMSEVSRVNAAEIAVIHRKANQSKSSEALTSTHRYDSTRAVKAAHVRQHVKQS